MAISSAEQGRLESATHEPLTAVHPAARWHSAEWVWQVTLLSLLLGAMLALALQMEFRLRNLGLPTSRFGARAGVALSLKESNDRLQEEVKRLLARNSEFETQLAESSNASGALKDELRELRTRAGLVPVTGPGLIIKLQDSPLKTPEEFDPQTIIHDSDINMVLNELKAAGAEVLGIAGADRSKIQRVIYRTVARCTGPGMDVNDTRLGGPYHLFAIGDPKELRAQLEMKNGVIKTLKLDVLKMVEIEEAASLTIPEYTGSFSFKHARAASPSR